MGELAASIAHEINQPLGAIVNNGNVGLRLIKGLKLSLGVHAALAGRADVGTRPQFHTRLPNSYSVGHQTGPLPIQLNGCKRVGRRIT